jgi:hypothetical protein
MARARQIGLRVTQLLPLRSKHKPKRAARRPGQLLLEVHGREA